MPALPPVPGVLRVFMEGKVDGEDIFNWGNVIHFRYSGSAPSNAVCATIAAQVGSEWATHMAPECPAPTTLQKVVVTDLTSNTSGQGESLIVHAGTRGDDSIPANAAVLITYAAPLRYRGGHPRQYLYVGGNADLEGAAKWSSAFQAEALSHWQAFITSMEGFTSSGCVLGTFCTVSYKSGNAPRVTPLVMNLDVTGAFVAAEMASQRRRIGRRKAHR